MKLLGVLFVVISASSVGWSLAMSVRRRCQVLGQLLSALRYMKSELSFHSTPLPQTFSALSDGAEGSVKAYFSLIASEMKEKCWLTPMTAMELASGQLTELPPADPARQVLRELGSGLGKFDLDSQLQEIDTALWRLDELRKHADAERTLRCKTYQTLGICAGLALAILLI